MRSTTNHVQLLTYIVTVVACLGGDRVGMQVGAVVRGTPSGQCSGQSIHPADEACTAGVLPRAVDVKRARRCWACQGRLACKRPQSPPLAAPLAALLIPSAKDVLTEYKQKLAQSMEVKKVSQLVLLHRRWAHNFQKLAVHFTITNTHPQRPISDRCISSHFRTLP